MESQKILGYATVITHPTKEDEIVMENVYFLDEQMDMYYDNNTLVNELSAQIEQKNALVVAFFGYESIESGGAPWDGAPEFCDSFPLISMTVLSEDAKQVWTNRITDHLRLLQKAPTDVFEMDIEVQQMTKRELDEWQEFYEEDFVLLPEEPVMVPLESIFGPDGFHSEMEENLKPKKEDDRNVF